MFKPDYPFSDHPRPGDRTQVAAGVYWLFFPLPFALNHVNLWLIDDGDCWTLVDTGYGSSATRELWETVFHQALDDKPIRRIIVTHYHPDHVGLAGWLAQRFDAEVVMTRREWALTRAVHAHSDAEVEAQFRAFFGGHGLAGEALDTLAANGNGYRRSVPSLPEAASPIAAGDTLTIGGQTWRVHIGRGHAPEHACLYRDSDHVLIGGDQILPRISSNLTVRSDAPEEDLVTHFVDSLHAIKAALPADTLVLPGHGRPFRGLGERVGDLDAHHRQQLDAAAAACSARALTAFDLLPVLFKRKLDSSQMMFAMGESIAHLNCLFMQGRVERSQRAGQWYFAATPAESRHRVRTATG